MLECSHPSYAQAKRAIEAGDGELLASCVQGAASSILTTRLKPKAFSKELWCSRIDCADIFMGADRCTGGISLCCRDFYCHFPCWMGALPLTRFPTTTWEYIETADPTILTLVEMIPGSNAPQGLFAALNYDAKQLAVTVEITAEGRDPISIQATPWDVERVHSSLKHLCGEHIGRRDQFTAVFSEHVVPADATWKQEGIVEGATVSLVVEPATTNGLVFEDVSTFDGVLYALGGGPDDYQNPAESGAVQVAFSADAANYYSSSTSHLVGDRAKASSIICCNTHPGNNATMWSQGAPNAYFTVDISPHTLQPTHYCYRGDAGGGENHPRSWELQGSMDGHEWVALRTHANDTSVQRHVVGSFPIEADPDQHFSMFRVQNQGGPNHILCCSGIEFWGNLGEQHEVATTGVKPEPTPTGIPDCETDGF